ncbi:MAG: potassium/proton antiporter [Marmoricola sp.]
MTFDVPTLDQALLVGAGVLLLAILAVRLSVGVGLPSLLVYLFMGVAMGESGLGLHFSNVDVAYALGFAALMIILAEGGLTTPWKQIRPVLRLGFTLATVGVAVSVTLVAVLTHYLLGLDWRTAVLLGAVTSPTDAAAVFSMLRRVPLPRRITATLEAESGLNDAPTVVLVTLVSTHASGFGWGSVGEVVYELLVGVALGFAVGWLGGQMMRRVALPSSGLYPTAVMAIAVLGYAAPATLHASGFAGVYVATLVLGNSELPHRAATRSFAEGLAWLAQIGLFVMLGLLSSPGRFDWGVIGTALAAGALLTLIARPVSVAVSSLAQPMPWREAAFISWAGLRGAVPIVLAMIPFAKNITHSQHL